MNTRTSLLVAVLALFAAVAAAFQPTSPDEGKTSPAGGGSRLGVGFLIGRATEGLIPLLEKDGDFLEMMLGPDKIRYVRGLKPSVRAMCVSQSLEGVASTIRLLKEAEVEPDRVYIAYNPEPRPPRARQSTPREELDDYLGSLKKARELAKEYGAPLIAGPGLSEMSRREHLYAEMARHCDIWMIQTQRLQVDPQTGEPVSPERYRKEVERIVGLLRKGNPDIRVFVQVIPLQATAERREFFTAERMAAYLLAVEGLVDSAKIYGGNAELITEVVSRLRGGAKAVEAGAKVGEAAAREDSRVGPGGRGGSEPCARASGRDEEPGLSQWASAKEPATPAKQTVMLEMRDGARLATDWYAPVSFPSNTPTDRVPVVLIRTPYDKGRRNPAMERWRDCLLRNGYAFAVQDMRGFFASRQEGRTGPGQYDGYDTIEWLAEQPWCNGKVGMMGYSHLGAAQYEAAVTAPAHLACAIPAQAPGNYYTDSLFPAKFRKADMETILRGVFTARTTLLWNTRIRRRDNSRLDQFSVPMMHSAGWYDFYKEGAIEMFRALQAQGGAGARGNQKLIIGPWGHGVAQEESPTEPLELPGGLAYPANAKLDWEKEVWLPWFDHWLKGKPSGIMDRPAVKYYLMGDVDDPQAPGNRWIEADDFPPESTAVPYYVHADRSLRTEAPPAEEGMIEYEYDPTDPVPTVGRFDARIPVRGPYDQREVEGRPDVLVFTSPELKKPLVIVGQVQAKLWASSDREDTDFTVKLTDVYPDGRSMLFLDGIVKARYRNTYLKEELLEAGKMYEFDIDLGYIAIAIAPGHRLRLAISSSNFDRWDINPNTGEPYGEHAVSRKLQAERLRGASPRGKSQFSESLVATNAIYMDARHPTHVTLPLVATT